MTANFVLRNARIVLPTEIILGSVKVEGGRVVDVSSGYSTHGEDLDGDFLMPGLIEIHTDNLERHLMPRPQVRWPALAALLGHDAEVAAAGITTVFDALGIGDSDAEGLRASGVQDLLDALAQARQEGLLRADHRLHIRCELPAPNTVELFEPFAHLAEVNLLSLMDHTPGQRQWSEIAHARTYFTGKKGWSVEKFERHVAEAPAAQERFARPHRTHFLQWAHAHRVPVASHDDTTPEHVAQALADGITIAEFPTTLSAARAARAGAMLIVMGGPNVVRGGSHSGNVAAGELARHDLLDALSSDYVPGSLLLGALRLGETAGWSIPKAINTVSRNPAQALQLNDRGAIEIGLRADLIRVRLTAQTPPPKPIQNATQKPSQNVSPMAAPSPSQQPAVRAVWRAGARVC